MRPGGFSGEKGLKGKVDFLQSFSVQMFRFFCYFPKVKNRSLRERQKRLERRSLSAIQYDKTFKHFNNLWYSFCYLQLTGSRKERMTAACKSPQTFVAWSLESSLDS